MTWRSSPLALMAILTFVCVTATAAPAATPKVYASTREVVTKLPLTGAKSYRYWTPYVVEVPDLAATDVVRCHAQAEVTTSYPFPVQVVRAIVPAPKGGLRGARRDRIHPVNPLYGENITLARHHMAIVTMATDTGREGTVRYALLLQAASTRFEPGQALTIEPGYGGIWCTVFK